nr:phosphorylase [Trinickia violacea]
MTVRRDPAAAVEGGMAQPMAALPIIAVTGMAFEARIARGDGVETVYAARADWLERALSEAVARGCGGIVSFGTAGGLAPGLEPGTLIIADAVDGPLGRIPTNAAWAARCADALAGTPLHDRVRRGTMAGVTAPVVSAQDKEHLHRSTGALAVDMESHIAGAIAAARGLPFIVCRAIVDPAWRTLPRAATAGLRDDGTTAIGPILRELARQPSQLGALIRLAADARAARMTLVQARHALGEAGALRPH